jgi:hypothetical protein
VPEIEGGVVAAAIREAINRAEANVQAAHTLLVTHGLPGAPVLQECLELMRGIRNGTDDQAIVSFRASHKKVKEGMRRATELTSVLNDTQLANCRRARRALDELWPFLDTEADLADSVRQAAQELRDLMARETFFKELPAIDQKARALEEDYQARYQKAVTSRAECYTAALQQLRAHPAWPQLTEAQQGQIAGPLEACTGTDGAKPIPLLRADTDACPGRLQRAITDMMRIVDGNRLVSVNASGFFKGGLETEEQLDAALDGLREVCIEQIGAGKKVMIQW